MGELNHSQINGVALTPLRVVCADGGSVMHGVRADDAGFDVFGEAYFSQVNYRAIKAWKRHRRMTLNLIVPIGKIRFVLFDDREGSETYGKYQDLLLSVENYYRLTVPPMLWVGFQGVQNQKNILLNVANLVHDPKECDKRHVSEIPYDWNCE